MAWNGVITNIGLNLLNQWATGSQTLYIDKATTGSGTVPQANLRSSVTVAQEVDTATIVASVPVTTGTQFRIQVNANDSAAYTLHQVGVWGHLGEDGAQVLIALYQEDAGVSVPLATQSPNFVFTMYAIVAMSNTGSISVNVTPNEYVTQTEFEDAVRALEEEIDEITITVDTSLSTTSTNPVQNKAVAQAINTMQEAVDAKAPKASPAFTGTPTAPTASAGTGTTQIATTAFVQSALAPSLTMTQLQFPMFYLAGGGCLVTLAGKYTQVGITAAEVYNPTLNDWQTIVYDSSFNRGLNTVLIFTAPTTDPLTVGMVYLVRLTGTLA